MRCTKNIWLCLSVIAVVIGVIGVHSCKKTDAAPSAPTPTPVSFTVPNGWPQPAYDFTKNPLTQEGIALGRALFYEGKLSKDGNFPCASCHQNFAAFATFDHNFSHGFNNSFTTRNAPGTFNLAWLKNFHYDGGINHLDLQPLAPITAPNEMAETIANVINKLQNDAKYRQLFTAAYGDDNITTERMTKALSQFMLTMVSNNSKYDLVKAGKATFTLPEQLGYDLFKNKGCVSCHTEPLFTNNDYINIGMPVDPTTNDYGRMRVTNNRTDSLKFKVPTLRNVQLTFPYGHDGRFTNLDAVLEHYRSGVVNGPTTDARVRNRIALSNFEIGQIKAFLNTLTDTVLTKNPAFAQP